MSDAKTLIQKAREELELSQSELANAVDVSQSTISRLEKLSTISDIRLAAKLAMKLKLDVNELLSDQAKQLIGSWVGEEFYAFCPNPFCDSNRLCRNRGGEAAVEWDSGTTFSYERFEELNFCRFCGTEVIKQCPGCGRSFTDGHTTFCSTCGSKVTDRPSKEEWEQIRELIRPVISEDDIPF